MRLGAVLMLALPLMLCACEKQEPAAEAAGAPPGRERARLAQISPEAARAAGIELSEAGPSSVHETLPLYGVIAPNGDRVRNVSARFPGIVRSVSAAVGQAVVAGEALAAVESNDSLQTYPVTAPIGGMVTVKSVNPGEAVADQAMFVIADLSTVWVELTLFPKDLARVRVGQTVRVRAVDGGLEDSARIIWVSAVGESSSQSVTARALLANSARRWKPGLYVSGDVLLNEAVAPVAVLVRAVQRMDEHSVVFVPSDRGYEARTVRLGRSDDERVEVMEGLAAGEKYVSGNSFVIKSEIEKDSAGHEQD